MSDSVIRKTHLSTANKRVRINESSLYLIPVFLCVVVTFVTVKFSLGLQPKESSLYCKFEHNRPIEVAKR